MGRKKEEVFNERAFRTNAGIIDYCRTSGSVIAGVIAGVMGLTGLYGFVFFFIYSAFLSVLLVAKAGTSWRNYFASSGALWFDGILGGLFTYVLLWTFMYGMVHVY